MNHIKGSAVIKIAAWIGLTLSVAVFLGSIVGAYVFMDMGVYEYNTSDELKNRAYEEVSEQYAVRTLANMGTGENEEFFENKSFQYGIICGKQLDGVDLNAESTYVERNFTQEVTQDELYTITREVGKNTRFYYSDTLFGSYNIYEETAINQKSAAIDLIYYDMEGGIFYYAVDGNYYPVKRVSLDFYFGENQEEPIRYSFEYEFEKKMYRNLYLQEQNAATNLAEGTKETADIVSADTENVLERSGTTTEDKSEDVKMLLKKGYITFNMLDDTSQSCDTWNALLLDGIECQRGEVTYIEQLPADDHTVTEETNYYLDSDNSLTIIPRDKTIKTYQVVVILPKSVGTGWGSEDLFVQANTLVNLMYQLRYSIYFIAIAAFVISLVLFVYLVSAAGHRKEKEGIAVTFIDRIPFDLYLGIALAGEIMLLYMLVATAEYINYLIINLIMISFLILCMFWLVLLSVLSFAVRIKKRTLWTNTIVYRILSWFARGISFLVRNIPLLYKVILVIGGISFAEMIGIVVTSYHTSMALVCWLLEKMLLVPFILICIVQMNRLQEGSKKIAEGNLTHRIETEKMFWEFKKHGNNLNSISEGMSRAVDERMKSERFKTELITNVSHDIKTPLTSIINYVDLLEKEALQNEKADEYLEVLERQSARLKKLIEDLMEASKASTGNLPVALEKLEAGVFMVQTVGEFEEKTEACNLQLIITKPDEEVYILADGRHFWRVIDNLMNNICKYAQPGTRVYINLEVIEQRVILTFRNTSKYPLNITSGELMERFVRGDSSRNTEGSGLGLSIANSLMDLMNGTFEIYVDGDLFKVELGFKYQSDNSDF